MALTQKQLLDNTPGVVKMRTKVCSIRLIGAGKQVNDKKLGKCYQFMYNLRCLDGNRFVTLKYIGNKKPGLGEDRDQDDGKPDENSPVWVSCTCPYHMYNTEYALAKQGNSSILYGNGKPPVVRNPHNIPYVCKHVVLALETATHEGDQGEAPETTQKKVEPQHNWRKRLVNWMTGREKENVKQELKEQQKDQNTQQNEKTAPSQRSQPVKQPVTTLKQNPVVQQPVDTTTQQLKQELQVEQNQNQTQQKTVQNNQKQQPATWRQRLKDWMSGNKQNKQ